MTKPNLISPTPFETDGRQMEELQSNLANYDRYGFKVYTNFEAQKQSLKREK